MQPVAYAQQCSGLTCSEMLIGLWYLLTFDCKIGGRLLTEAVAFRVWLRPSGDADTTGVKAPYNDALYTDNRVTTTENGWFALQNFFLTTDTTPDTTTSQIGKVSLYSNLTLAAKRACRPFPLCLGASNCVQSATKEHILVLQPLPTLECLENVCS